MTRKCRVAVLMATLMLVGGGLAPGWLRGNGAAQATNGGGLLQAGLGVEVGDLALFAESDGSESLESEVFQVNKVQSDSIYNLWLNWAKKRIVFNWLPVQEWQLRTAHFVYRNYEEGVTEAEADSAAQNLGEDDFSDWAISATTGGVNVAFGPLAQIDLREATVLAKNLTNQLYYAMKFVNPADDSEYLWVRGKLDYRSCAHSPLYQQKTTKCTMDVADGYYQPTLRKDDSMTVLPLPEGYKIPDWDTEWREILQSRAARVQETLDNTEKYLKNFVTNMDQVEQLLDGLAKTSGAQSGTEEIANGLDGQRQRLEDLRSYYNNLFGSSDNGELDELRAKYQVILAENQELVAENDALRAENSELNKQITEVDCTKCSVHDQGVSGVVASDGLTGSGAQVPQNAFEPEVVQYQTQVQSAVTVQATSDEVKNSETVSAVSNFQSDNVEKEAEIEVPKLGKSTNMNIWLGVTLIAVALGLLAIWVKRLLERK